MAKRRLFAFDLDLTLWDHPDVSSLTLPVRRVRPDEVRDSAGDTVRLRPCARELLEELKSRGFLLAVVSWNLREKGEAVLRELGLLELFDYVVIESHPNKDEMFEKLLGMVGEVEEVYYVDDNPTMIRLVKGRFPWIKAFLYGRDVKDLCDLLSRVRGAQGGII